MLATASVFAASLIFVGLFLYQAHAQTSATRVADASSQSSADKIYLDSRAPSSAKGYLSDRVNLSSAEAVSPVQVQKTLKAPMLEVHIANNGLVLLRGARVIALSGNIIRVGMTWGTSDVTWSAATHYNTRFLTSDGQKETLGDIKVGDFVTVTGQLIASGKEPTVDTDYVREY